MRDPISESIIVRYPQRSVIQGGPKNRSIFEEVTAYEVKSYKKVSVFWVTL